MNFRLYLMIVFFGSSLASATELSLNLAINQALENDQWLVGSRLREAAFRDEAVRDSSLPDPTVSIGVANLPTDNWDFDRENMTQFKVGVTQRFPGGDSRAVKARKSRLMADLTPIQRSERKAKVTERISHLWLDGYLAKQSIALIERDRHLFEQLIDVTTARYKSALGKARQQDVVRAQLELTKLEDRLTRLRLQFDTTQQLLAEWLPPNYLISMSVNLPDIPLPANLSTPFVSEAIKRHPQLLAADKQIEVLHAQVDLARQAYKPGWALNASYGYRDDSPEGFDRSDFFSLGVSFDLPVFTKNRQDRSVSAAKSRQQALSMDYQLLERQLLARGYKTLSELTRLNERSNLYEQTLLKQMGEQVEASLSAYTNDDGDFADVMRAYIAELNSKIEWLEISVNYRKAAATMNYLLVGLTVSQSGEQ